MTDRPKPYLLLGGFQSPDIFPLEDLQKTFQIYHTPENSITDAIERLAALTAPNYPSAIFIVLPYALPQIDHDDEWLCHCHNIYTTCFEYLHCNNPQLLLMTGNHYENDMAGYLGFNHLAIEDLSQLTTKLQKMMKVNPSAPL